MSKNKVSNVRFSFLVHGSTHDRTKDFLMANAVSGMGEFSHDGDILSVSVTKHVGGLYRVAGRFAADVETVDTDDKVERVVRAIGSSVVSGSPYSYDSVVFKVAKPYVPVVPVPCAPVVRRRKPLRSLAV